MISAGFAPRMTAVAALVTLTLCGCVGSETSVRPGVNDSYLAPDVDVDKLRGRFEVESREIFAHRARIAAALRMTPGMAVADVGAGTGLFLDLFTKAVGPQGKVYAVDLAPKLVAHLQQRVAKKGYAHATVVQCTERSVELAPNSVDLAFICDTYHHFEYPKSTLSSIHRALRPGGRLVVVDFERIPGKSRQWVLDHVRAGKDVVRREIELAGFRMAGESAVRGLRENYLVQFTRD